MQKYLSDSLSKDEKRKIEMHLADCEMCTDELEGLSLLNNPQKLDFIITELNSKIDNRTTTKKGVFLKKIKPYYSIAALVLILISITSLLIFNNLSSEKLELAESLASEEVGFSDEPAMMNEKLVADKSILNDTLIQSFKRNKKQLAQDFEINIDEITKEEFFTSDDALIKTDEFEEYNTMNSETLISSNRSSPVLDSTKKNAKTAINSNGERVDENLIDEEDLVNSEIAYSNLSEEKNKSAENKKSSAKRETNKMLFVDTLNLAKTEFGNKRYQKTIELLVNQKLDKQNKNFAEANWYLALSYIELNQIDKAKSILINLKDFENPYQLKAQRKLKSVE